MSEGLVELKFDKTRNIEQTGKSISNLSFSAVHPEVASVLPQRPRGQLGPAVRPRRRVPPRAEAEAAPAPRPQESQLAPRQPRAHTQGTNLNPVVVGEIYAGPEPQTICSNVQNFWVA